MQNSAILLSGANHHWPENREFINNPKDGIVTASEVSNLDLENTKLVILSACDTGLGKVYSKEGVFGLQRAFKIAGVDHVISSLWKVNDEASKDLMCAFKFNLLHKKQDPALALKNAKFQLREDGYDPVDWAAYILTE